MEKIMKCRYHLVMFNRYRTMTFIVLTTSIIVLLSNVIQWGIHKTFSKHFIIGIITLLILFAYAMGRLNFHAEKFEFYLGIDIQNELISSEKKEKLKYPIVVRMFNFLFSYYPLAQTSFDRFEIIERSI